MARQLKIELKMFFTILRREQTRRYLGIKVKQEERLEVEKINKEDRVP
jgi:hypothetical protein